ncbi:hypothetical protein TNCV_1398711 [Trichonephila clavipes]|nr:hypothetical protein TNCV_1398711 [Trichonephila clavipes]
MVSRQRLEYSKIWRIVGRLEEGQSQGICFWDLGVSRNVVPPLRKQFIEIGTVIHQPGNLDKATKGQKNHSLKFPTKRSTTVTKRCPNQYNASGASISCITEA